MSKDRKGTEGTRKHYHGPHQGPCEACEFRALDDRERVARAERVEAVAKEHFANERVESVFDGLRVACEFILHGRDRNRWFIEAGERGKEVAES